MARLHSLSTNPTTLLCVLQGWDGTQGAHDGVMARIDALLQVQIILQRRAGRQVREAVCCVKVVRGSDAASRAFWAALTMSGCGAARQI